MMSGSAPVGDCLPVLHAEWVCIYTGLELAIQAGFRKIVVASDDQSAIQACNGNLVFADYDGTIVKDTRRLADELEAVYFVFKGIRPMRVRTLQRNGVALSAPVIVIEEVPASINSCIMKDLATVA